MNKKKVLLASTLAILIAPSILENISNQTTIKADTTTASADTINNPIGTVDYGGADTVDASGNKTGLFLSEKSSWKLGQSILINGQGYYGVGTNQYVSSQNITVTDGMPPVEPLLIKSTSDNQTGTLSATVKVVNSNGTATGTTLPAGSSWKLGDLYFINGNTYYKVGSDEYVTSNTVKLDTQTTSPQTQGTATQNTVTLGHATKVLDANGNPNGIVLPAGSSWQLGQAILLGDNGYCYQVATNEYIPWNAVSSANYSFTATLKNDVTIYNSVSNSLTRTLPAGSSWKITDVTHNQKNEFWGKVSTNEWIKIDSNLDMSYGDADSIPNVAVNVPDFAANILTNTTDPSNPDNVDQVQTTINLYNASNVLDDNGNDTGKAMPAGSSWYADQSKSMHDYLYFRIAPNQWVTNGGFNGSDHIFANGPIDITLAKDVQLYDTSSNSMTRTLTKGSSWRVFNSVINKEGQIFAQVSTNEWIPLPSGVIVDYADGNTILNGLGYAAKNEPEFAISLAK